MYEICFYHDSCSDGIASAFIIKNEYSEIYLKGVKAGVKEIDLSFYKNKNVIFLDVCPEENLINDILKHSKTITILDHHITSQKTLEKYNDNIKITKIFDMNRSGCQITWDFLNYPNNRPWFIDYIGDRDLRKFNLPNSKLINLGLFEFNHITLEGLENLYNSLDNKENIINNLLHDSKVIEEKNKRTIIYDSYKAVKVKFKNYNIWLGSTSFYLISDFGIFLAKKEFEDGSMPDFAAIYKYEFKDRVWKISLRSISTDVSLIAKEFNGGGHKLAAGFEFGMDLNNIFIL